MRPDGAGGYSLGYGYGYDRRGAGAGPTFSQAFDASNHVEAAGVAIAEAPAALAAAEAAYTLYPNAGAFTQGHVRGLTHTPGTPPNPYAVVGYYAGRYTPVGWELAKGLFNRAYERLLDGRWFFLRWCVPIRRRLASTRH